MQTLSEVPAKAVMLFQGGAQANRDETDHEPVFRQESTFQYLFGIREPGCYGTIDIDSGETTVFIPRLPAEYATWMGPIAPASHFQECYAVEKVRYVDELEQCLKDAAPSKLYLSKGYNSDSGSWGKPADFEGMKQFDTDGTSLLYDQVVECRVIKTEKEIALMAHVNDLSNEAHLEVMRRIKPGMKEYQLEAMFRHWVFFHGGCRHTAYTSICGCGPNSGVLHYGHAGAPNDRLIGDGEMLLLDMGGEYHCYASDITCSFPSNGVFTADQKVIFEAVAAMQVAVMDAMKPGVPWKDMHTLSYEVVACEHLLAAGLLQGKVTDMMMANIGAVFMPHGLGHFMGLDTHDVGGYPKGVERDTRPGHRSLRCGRVLQEGMVITVEPGIYFIDHLLDEALANESTKKFFVQEAIARFRGTGGVRLEDDVIVTSTGIRNMTNCPRTVADVEAVMAGTLTKREQLWSKAYQK
ncbi:unnamed protein product [Chrysoparadoxa australica]